MTSCKLKLGLLCSKYRIFEHIDNHTFIKANHQCTIFWGKDRISQTSRSRTRSSNRSKWLWRSNTAKSATKALLPRSHSEMMWSQCSHVPTVNSKRLGTAYRKWARRTWSPTNSSHSSSSRSWSAIKTVRRTIHPSRKRHKISSMGPARRPMNLGRASRMSIKNLNSPRRTKWRSWLNNQKSRTQFSSLKKSVKLSMKTKWDNLKMGICSWRDL